MWDYTDKVMELFYNPKNQGLLEETSEPSVKVVTGEVGSITCGDALRLHLKVDVDSEKILDSRFQTFGCTSAIASSSALTEMIKGLTLDEALKVTNKDIAEYLGGLPEAKMHCSVMGQEALESAIYNYRGISKVEHEEDEGALVCQCFGISEPKIRRVIVENDLTDVEQVTNYLKAGGGCGSCLATIEDLLVEAKQGVGIAVPIPTAAPVLTAPGKTLTNLQKISLIQQVLQEEVRPILAADGGDVELFDVEGDRVKVLLKGACGGCPSSSATLKVAIEARLQERVLSSLVVEAV